MSWKWSQAPPLSRGRTSRISRLTSVPGLTVCVESTKSSPSSPRSVKLPAARPGPGPARARSPSRLSREEPRRERLDADQSRAGTGLFGGHQHDGRRDTAAHLDDPFRPDRPNDQERISASGTLNPASPLISQARRADHRSAAARRPWSSNRSRRSRTGSTARLPGRRPCSGAVSTTRPPSARECPGPGNRRGEAGRRDPGVVPARSAAKARLARSFSAASGLARPPLTGDGGGASPEFPGNLDAGSRTAPLRRHET